MASPLHPALAAGEELLAVLQQPISEEMLLRVDQLLDLRAAAADSADAEVLSQLTAQQAVLEAEMKRVLEALGLALRQSQSRGEQVQSAQRLMKASPTARLISEKR